MDRLESAFRSAQPYEALRNVLKAELAAGGDREALRLELEAYRVELRGQGREHDDDVVLEVLDDVAGWAGPNQKL